MKTFKELELITPVQYALSNENYERPTPIQEQTIPPALKGRDILGCAQTGTGKTAAFALPILNRLGHRSRKSIPNRPLALVLAPTRELAIQIDQSFERYGANLKLRRSLVYGGVNQNRQVRTLDRGVHILVATPGRLLDLINQGHVHLDRLDMFVLDEADRMLDMGFLPDIKRIMRHLPEQRQSLFFSATLPPKITTLTKQLLRDPVHVNVTPPKSTSVEKIQQRVIFVERNAKLGQLQKILAEADRTLVFTRTKRGANLLSDKLVHMGIKATAIHGNKSQNARQRALEAFQRKRVRVLVATDVAARGIDIEGITHVVNFDLPNEPESYVHRIGRTGRAGAKGIAITFCSNQDRDALRAIEKLIGMNVPTAMADPRREVTRRKPTATSTARRKPRVARDKKREQLGSKTPQSDSAQTAEVQHTQPKAEGTDGQAKRRPRRRKRNTRQRAKQTN